ncbi:MAG TPA: flagellar hook-associated protein FlgL [Candidatus Elarobacter sp.]|jgi:flagellar hook-associated protein 3 FlgL|nr:flagellar hook-associated protein FlgL [Candidatus Elarobacter sp.]
MRIATSTIYAQQTAAIDDQTVQYAQLGTELSSGKQLNAPSDDPSQIAQDLQLHVTIDTTTQQSTNVQNAVNELTQTDSALSSLTSVMQSAQTLATQGASDTLSASQRASLADQVDQLLQQAIAIGNTQYDGKYVFAGTSTSANPPVVAQGNPISGVTFTGNEQAQGQLIYNDQQFALSTTFQSAFNFNSSDGSPDIFQTLINLRDTLQNGTAADASTQAINQAGAVVYGAGSPAPTTLAAANTFATTPVPDSSGNFSLEINGTVNGVQSVKTITVPANAPLDGGAGSVVGAINAVSAQTGVTATFDESTQKVTLTGTGSFYVSDVASAGATNAGNLTAVLHLASTTSSNQADMVQNVSTQLGDVANTLNVVLNARSVIGSRIQTLSSIGDQLQTSITDNTNVESGIEDVNVASATSKFTAVQTALQAAYDTTDRLESKTLFDYLT